MIRVTGLDGPGDIEVARELLLEYGRLREFDVALGDYDRELRELPGEYGAPAGSFLIAFDGEVPAGCVALRRNKGSVCEMKRLFVLPGHRGQQLGRTLVQGIIAQGRGLGYQVMRLDTHPWMRQAEALYRSVGFREIEAYRFNPIPGVRFFELDLEEAGSE